MSGGIAGDIGGNKVYNFSVRTEQTKKTNNIKIATKMSYPIKKKTFFIGLLITVAAVRLWFIILFLIISSRPEWRTLNLNDFFWGKILITSTMILFFVVLGLYWIPFIIGLSITDLAKTIKCNQNKTCNLFQNQREKYMIPILGGTIALSMLVQVTAHRETLWQAMEAGSFLDFFVHHSMYVLVYALVCAASIILTYRKIETNKIKRIRKNAVIIYFLLLPAVYFITIILETSNSDWAVLYYLWTGILAAPLLIMENIIIFLMIISVWYFIKEKTEQKRKG